MTRLALVMDTALPQFPKFWDKTHKLPCPANNRHLAGAKPVEL